MFVDFFFFVNFGLRCAHVVCVMYAVMMNKLMEEGVLDPSDPVTKFYNDQHPPAFKPVNPYDSTKGADAVTLESLAGQTSGLMREAPCLLNDDCPESDIINRSNNIPLFHQPLTRPHYSNYGFSLLGRCCARAAQEKYQNNATYEEWVEHNILEAMGMTNSGFDYTDEIISRMAVGCLLYEYYVLF